LGDTCRSPLAQGMLGSKVDPKKVDLNFVGTSAYHGGKQQDPRSIGIKKNGIIIQNQKMRQFHKMNLAASLKFM